MGNPAAGTAIGPMVIVAFDQHEPHAVVRDDLAARLLPAGTRPFTALARWPSVRRAMFRMTEKRIPGLWAGMLSRKRYIDEATVDAARDGAEVVVILGAGMDTRPYRLPELRDIPVYEVDLPANIDRKRKALRGAAPGNVTLVPLDFETQQLTATLAAAGYPAGATTLFIWEAVTQYLTEAGVRATFDFLAAAPNDSRLVFTFVGKDFLDGRNLYNAPAAYQDFVVNRKLWKFGMEPADVASFLAEYGWQEVEQLGAAEFRTRYIEPSGRTMDVSDLEHVVTATKTGP